MHWQHRSSPRLSQRHIKRFLLSLRFLQWERESPRWTRGCPSLMGPFQGGPVKFCSIWITGENRLDPWGSDRNVEGGWDLEQPALRSWQSHLFSQLRPRGDPSQCLSLFAEPSEWTCLAREIGAQFCLIWVTSQPPALDWEPTYDAAQAGNQICALPNCWVQHPVSWDKEAWPENPGSHKGHPTALLGQGNKPAVLPCC